MSEGLALSSALGTVDVLLHLEESHVDLLSDDAPSVALGAGLHVSVPGPCASALGAVNISVDVEVPLGPHI